jgi:hypothetical protein
LLLVLGGLQVTKQEPNAVKEPLMMMVMMVMRARHGSTCPNSS